MVESCGDQKMGLNPRLFHPQSELQVLGEKKNLWNTHPV